MFNLEQLEYLLVALVILLQFATFFATWRKMRLYRQVIPADFKLSSEAFPGLTYGAIGNDNNKYRNTLMESLCGYLVRTKQTAPDFNQVKDIIERNTGVPEEEISHITSVPLYLGLMGTMIGVVVGLWNMNNISAAINSSDAGNAMGNGINVLLGGVKIAMIASFTGILLTVIGSSFLFNNARRHVESEKNRLYNFIQNKLLPGLSKNLVEGIQGIQNKMNEFSQNFGTNLTRLEDLLHKNYNTLEVQKSILDTLSAVDVADFAQANVKILRELRQGTEQLQKFNVYVDKLTEFTGVSQKFSASMEGMLQRTGNIEDVLHNISTHFEMSADLLNFLKSHFAQLEERGSLIQQSLIKVDTILDDSLNELKSHIQAKIDAIKEFAVTENIELKNALSENKDGLGKLLLLENINSNTKEANNILPKKMESLYLLLQELNCSLQEHFKIIRNKKSHLSRVWSSLLKKHKV